MKTSSDLVAATTTFFLGFDPWSAGLHYVEIPALPARQSVEWRQTTFSPETLGLELVGTQLLRERLAEMDLTPITVGAYASVLQPDDLRPLLRRIDFAQQLGASFVIIDAAGVEPTEPAEWRQLGNLGRFLGDYAQDMRSDWRSRSTKASRAAEQWLGDFSTPSTTMRSA